MSDTPNTQQVKLSLNLAERKSVAAAMNELDEMINSVMGSRGIPPSAKLRGFDRHSGEMIVEVLVPEQPPEESGTEEEPESPDSGDEAEKPKESGSDES